MQSPFRDKKVFQKYREPRQCKARRGHKIIRNEYEQPCQAGPEEGAPQDGANNNRRVQMSSWGFCAAAQRRKGKGSNF